MTMKHLIEFNMPDDKEELEIVQQAGSMHSVLWELGEKLRSIVKYNNEGYSEQEMKVIESIREEYHNLLKEYNVNFY